MKRITALAAPALLALTLGAGSALALDPDPVERTVNFDRHELTTEAGRQAVRARLAEAAADVCRVSPRDGIEMQRLSSQCETEALAEAERALEQRIAQMNEGTIRLAEAKNR